MKRYIHIFKTLLKIENSKKWIVIQMTLSCCLYNLATLLPPIATAGIIAMVTENNLAGVWLYAGAYVVFYVIYFAMLGWNYHTYTVLARHYHMEVQRHLFEKVSSSDTIFTKFSRGKVIGTCSDDVRYLVDVADCATEALMKIAKLIVIFVIFMNYNILVATLAAGLDLLYLWTMNRNSRKIAKFYEGTRKLEDKIIDIFNQMATNLHQVRTLNVMDKLDENINKTRNKWREQYNGKRRHLTERYCAIPGIVQAGKIALYVLLASFVINGSMSLDQLILLISYFELAVSCTDELLDYLLNLSNYGVRIDRIKAILEYKPGQETEFGEVDLDDIDGLVEFKNVSFAIGRKEILNNISFKAPAHAITAIVGHSGSGKSSILNLLYRLSSPKSGEILIDHKNIYEYTKEVYSSNVAGVYQKPFMFDMSIRENFALVDSDHEAQIAACKRVGIHDLIMSLPKGYNTVICEDEHTFTEGQKQLMVIARALLTKSEILLMDEVTSNVDASATADINQLLMDLKNDHTILLVTHKPEMMAIADRVVVMDSGHVVATGGNRAVYNRSGLYRELTSRTFASISPQYEEGKAH